MPKLLAWILLVAALLVSLSGCGGNTITNWVGDYKEPAVYNVAYNRGGGKMTITVGKNAMVTITIVDDAAGTYVGTGPLRSDESFNFIKVIGPNGDSLTVEGSLKRSALSKYYAGKTVGSITFSYDAPLAVGNVSTTIFAGNYSGSVDYRNFDSYDFVGTVDSNGFINCQLGYQGKPVNLVGLLYSDGHLLLKPADGEKAKLYGKGACYLFAATGSLKFTASLSTTKDGKEVGLIRADTPWSPTKR